MRLPSVTAWVAAALCLLAALSSAPLAHGSAVTAGAPEHLVATGGECVRTFHSKGGVGCRSLSNGDMAPLYPIATSDELAAFVRGEAPGQESGEKYALVMPEALLSYAAIESGLARIGGVFAYPQFASANATFGSPYPQGFGTVDGALNPFAGKKVAWNRAGNGLVERELPFPVVLLRDEETGAQFLKRARANSQAGSSATYKAFLKYYFGPEAMTSLQCLRFTNIYGQRSPKCDPIGGQSAWAVRGDRSAKPIVLATAAMDAAGLSHVLAPGANTAASGVVALLAAAQALAAVPDASFDKRLVFAAFQAEKFGFVGSRRFLADLQTFAADAKACAFPVAGSRSPFGADFCTAPMLPSTAFAQLALADVAFAVAVDQVGVLPKSGNLSVHVNPGANASAALARALLAAPAAAGAVALGSAGALPPTPLTSFVNGAEFGRADLPAAVLAGYDTEFSAPAFDSRHDVAGSVDAGAVAKAAQVLAETLYALAVRNASSAELASIAVDRERVREMLACVSGDHRCALMNNVSAPAVATMIEYVGGFAASSWPAFSRPATLYPGPLDVNRQMLVRKQEGDAVSYFTVYNRSWSEDSDRVKLFPNAYEVFARAALAAAMVDAPTAASAPKCAKSQDCADGGRGLECVYPGVCAKQSAFFHLALSPGLARTGSLGVYDVLNESMPLWTEPQWDSDIGSYVFPDPGELVGWLALLAGVVVTGAGVALARLFLASVHKMKLL